MAIEENGALFQITEIRARYITGIMNLLSKNRDSISDPNTIPNSCIEQLVCNVEPVIYQENPDEVVYTRTMTRIIFDIGKFTSSKQIYPLLKIYAEHDSENETLDEADSDLTLKKKKKHKQSKRKEHKNRIKRKRSKSSKSNGTDEVGDEMPRKKRKHRREKSSTK